MKEEWALDLRDQCIQQATEFFFKQWGGLRPKEGGRLLQGREYNAPIAMTI
jgi:protein gp37